MQKRKSLTLNRAALANAVHLAIGLSARDSGKMVDDLLRHVTASLARGEDVNIGGFGRFFVRTAPARIGRNPKTGTLHPIPARRTLVFRAAESFRRSLAPRLSS